MGKQFTRVAVHASGRVIPEQTYLKCEKVGCEQEIRMADAYSYPACIALSGPTVHVSLACPEEQHFGCSHECALALHNQCMSEHIYPQLQALERQQQAQQQLQGLQQP